MSTIIRWGVVGTGTISSAFGGDCAFAEHAALSAVCSRSSASAQAYAERFGADQTFISLEEMLASGTIDALYIGTPNTAHGDAARAALEHGIPCLVEKPMVMTAREAEDLFKLAADRNLFLMEALWTRFLPAVQHAVRLVQDGAIGVVENLHADFSFDEPFDETSRLYAPSLGGGALYDLGVYPLAIADLMLGPPERVDGQWQAAPTGVDMRAEMTYRAAGIDADLACGFDRDVAIRCTIGGSRGGMVIHPPFFGAERFTIARTREAFAALLENLEADDLPDVETFNTPHRGSGLEYEIEAASRAILDGATTHPLMPPEKTLQSLRIIERILAQQPVASLSG